MAHINRSPDGITTFNTEAFVGSPGDTEGRAMIRMGTFLCPHCDKTHVVIQMSHDFETARPSEIMEITFKMTADHADKMANEFSNPNPLDPKWVIDSRKDRK